MGNFTQKLNSAVDDIDPAPTGATGVYSKRAHRVVLGHILRALNPFEPGGIGGTPDYMAPEIASMGIQAPGSHAAPMSQPFDEDLISYFYTIMAKSNPEAARLWAPAVKKYKYFEQLCVHTLAEDNTAGQAAFPVNLSGKIDKLIFKRIAVGLKQIKTTLLDHDFGPINEAFAELYRYVVKVAPFIRRALLSGTVGVE